MKITPWVRSFNYFDHYFKLVYDIYSGCYISAYPVTYYSIDYKNSIFEKDNLVAGAYDKNNYGYLSGIKFKKISLFPVFSINPMTPKTESGEKGGITHFQGMNTTIIFPSTFGLKPTEGDIIDLSFGYLSNSDVKNNMIYHVTNIEISHQSDYYQMYQLSLALSSIDKTVIERKISSYHIFLDWDRKIHPAKKASMLLKLQDKGIDLVFHINSIYNRSGFYIWEKQ